MLVLKETAPTDHAPKFGVAAHESLYLGRDIATQAMLVDVTHLVETPFLLSGGECPSYGLTINYRAPGNLVVADLRALGS